MTSIKFSGKGSSTLAGTRLPGSAASPWTACAQIVASIDNERSVIAPRAARIRACARFCVFPPPSKARNRASTFWQGISAVRGRLAGDPCPRRGRRSVPRGHRRHRAGCEGCSHSGSHIWRHVQIQHFAGGKVANDGKGREPWPWPTRGPLVYGRDGCLCCCPRLVINGECLLPP